MENPDDRIKKILRSKMPDAPLEPADLKDRIWNRIQNESSRHAPARWKKYSAILAATTATIGILWFMNAPSPTLETEFAADETEEVEELLAFDLDDSEEIELVSFYESL